MTRSAASGLSSALRPLCAARSLSFLSTSGAKCTSIAFSVRKPLTEASRPRNNPHTSGVQSFEATRAGLRKHDVSQWRAIMFDQIVSEKTARKPLAVALSISGQAAALGLAILFPLWHTQAITTGRVTVVPVLRPWGERQQPQKPAAHNQSPAKPGPRFFPNRTLLQPPRIPTTVAMIEDAPAVESIPGSSAFNGTPDGVFSVLDTNTA